MSPTIEDLRDARRIQARFLVKELRLVDTSPAELERLRQTFYGMGGEWPMQQSAMSDQGEQRPRGPVREEISKLWNETQQLRAGFQSLLERIQRLENEMRGETYEQETDTPKVAPRLG